MLLQPLQLCYWLFHFVLNLSELISYNHNHSNNTRVQWIIACSFLIKSLDLVVYANYSPWTKICTNGLGPQLILGIGGYTTCYALRRPLFLFVLLQHVDCMLVSHSNHISSAFASQLLSFEVFIWILFAYIGSSCWWKIFSYFICLLFLKCYIKNAI